MLLLFAVHPVGEVDGGLLIGRKALLDLLEDVDDVLGGAVVRALGRPAVALADLGGGEGAALDGGLDGVCGLRVVGGPAEIPGWHEARVEDGG